jgi:hypothetical protein
LFLNFALSNAKGKLIRSAKTISLPNCAASSQEEIKLPPNFFKRKWLAELNAPTLMIFLNEKTILKPEWQDG